MTKVEKHPKCQDFGTYFNKKNKGDDLMANKKYIVFSNYYDDDYEDSSPEVICRTKEEAEQYIQNKYFLNYRDRDIRYYILEIDTIDNIKPYRPKKECVVTEFQYYLDTTEDDIKYLFYDFITNSYDAMDILDKTVFSKDTCEIHKPYKTMYEARVVMLLDVPDDMNFEDFKEYAMKRVKDYFQKELKKENYKVEVDDD